ncbi:MAG: hypothetical protein Q9172_002888 [Xanthocarpia lactea]
MAPSGATPKGDEYFDFSDDDTEALFASPSRPKPTKTAPTEVTRQPSRGSEDGDDGSVEAREAALRKELAGIRNINQVIEGVVNSLERAQGNMDTVSRTVNDASTLLNTWTRILSQTEHNQRLILDPSWHGATQDMADMENESLLKQQEKERRELEEMQRREAKARKVEEDDRKKLENAGVKSSRGARGLAAPESLELGAVSAGAREVAQEDHEWSRVTSGVLSRLNVPLNDPPCATAVHGCNQNTLGVVNLGK